MDKEALRGEISQQCDQFCLNKTDIDSNDQFTYIDNLPFSRRNFKDTDICQKEDLNVSEHFISLTYGFQLDKRYSHEKTNANIMAVTYNNRLRQFVILDTRGIVTWKPDKIDSKAKRALLYPKYEHRVITALQYVKKYNCYFILDKDFIVKVLNKNFEEIYSMESGTIGASFMVFNSVTDELFTGGVGGTKVWQFQRVSSQMFKEIKHLSDYKLTLKNSLPDVGGSWVQRIEINPIMQHLYCCSEMDMHVYNMSGKLLYHIERAHTMAITGCCFSHKAKVIATASLDSTVKIWGLNGGLLHVFHGHSRPVSNLLLHPENSLMLISSSYDGTIRVWSLETMDSLYSLLVSACDGPMWMFLTEENLLTVCTVKEISIWSLNHFVNFWGLTRCSVFHMSLQKGSPHKTTRLLTIGEDGSVRLFARKTGNKLCTVLPPPCLSPLEQLPGFCYSRDLNLIYLLLLPDSLWIYTSRTDPACRLAVWDINKLQSVNGMTNRLSKSGLVSCKQATECWQTEISRCTTIGFLSSPIVISTEVSQYCPDSPELLLWGLQDGRILFMDPMRRGLKYLEFKASNNPIVELYHDKLYKSLVVRSQQQNNQTSIQIRSLPFLILQFTVLSGPNLTAWTRLSSTLLTGHQDGHLQWLTMTPVDDLDPLQPKAYPDFVPELKQHSTRHHQEAVLVVDTCHSKEIFCSCSLDGNIKVWDTLGTLLQEIAVDSPLNCICFLNDKADLLVAFRNHIFCIPHSKVCPFLVSEQSECSLTEDSDIYEDLFIIEEGLVSDTQGENDMDSYLVPYEMDFSKYFLEGRLSEMQLKDSEHEKDDELDENLTNRDGAPTDIYLSPREQLTESWSSISSLSHIDVPTDSQEFNSQYPIFGDSPTHILSPGQNTDTSPESSIKDKLEEAEEVSFSTTGVTEEKPEASTPKIVAQDLTICKEDTSPVICSPTTTTATTTPQTSTAPLRRHLKDIAIDATSLMKSSKILDQNQQKPQKKSISAFNTEIQNVSTKLLNTKTKPRKKQLKKCALKQKKHYKFSQHSKNKPDQETSTTDLKVIELTYPSKKPLEGGSPHQTLDQKEGTLKAVTSEQTGCTNYILDTDHFTGETTENQPLPTSVNTQDETSIANYMEERITDQSEDISTTAPISTDDTGTILKGDNHIEEKMQDLIHDDGKNEIVFIPQHLPLTVKVKSKHPRTSLVPGQWNNNKSDQEVNVSRQRPHTSQLTGNRYSGDLQTEFDLRLADFTKRFSCGSSKSGTDVLHENIKTNFGKDWTEKEIERHQLVQIQRKLRIQSARDKRHRSVDQRCGRDTISVDESVIIVPTETITQGNRPSSQQNRLVSQNTYSMDGYTNETLQSNQQRIPSTPLSPKVVTTSSQCNDKHTISTSHSTTKTDRFRGKLQENKALRSCSAPVRHRQQKTWCKTTNTVCKSHGTNIKQQRQDSDFPQHPESWESRFEQQETTSVSHMRYRQYKLMDQDKEANNSVYPKPSLLEGRLLSERFPQTCFRVLRYHNLLHRHQLVYKTQYSPANYIG